MSEYPRTGLEVVENLHINDVEYVADIGSEKRYGLGVSGDLNIDEETVRVLGSVVLNEESGEPVLGKGTSFHAYPNGLAQDSLQLLTSQEAVNAIAHIYKNTKSDSTPFKPKYQVNIRPNAR